MSTNFYNNSSFSDTPYGLKLRQTITTVGTSNVTGIPSSIKRVYAVCIGAGGGGGLNIFTNTRYITEISGNGTTITYTCNNDYVAGMRVTVTGSNISGYNVTNANIATASSTQFTVTNSATGTHTPNNNTFANGSTITTAGSAGGIITTVTPSSPNSGLVTYSTTTIVPVGTGVTISGASPAGYNGSYVVVASNPGTSFTVSNATTGAATGTITFTGVIRFTAANNYKVGSLVTTTGHTPIGYNLSQQLVIAADSTGFTMNGSLAQGTALTVNGTSQFNNSTSGAGGGGAGGVAAGWTYVPQTCTVGAGGAGGKWNTTPWAVSTATNGALINNRNGHAERGGSTQFGYIIAGGGAGGAGHNNGNMIPANQNAFYGGGGGGASGILQPQTIGASYTGAPPGVSGGVSAAGNGGSAGTNGGDGVSGGGGGNGNGGLNQSITAGSGGNGMIGGGGGSSMSYLTSNGGNGGNSDKYNGGSGSSQSATITNVVGDGATVTYTANNNYVAGDIVSISGVSPSAYNLINVIVASATSSQFTVTNSATGTFSSGGIAQTRSLTAGAGGGGAGYLGPGSDAVRKQGGNGGDGGGGGGASSGDGDFDGGNGGNGVIFIYY